MALDGTNLSNLEILRNITSGSYQGSLLSKFDATQSPTDRVAPPAALSQGEHPRRRPKFAKIVRTTDAGGRPDYRQSDLYPPRRVGSDTVRPVDVFCGAC